MCSNFRTGNVSSLIGYTSPTLHKGVRWFVDFFALDPASNNMRRKRYYIGNNLTIAEKKRRASEIIQVLTVQLSQGWNPWVTADDARGFVTFDECLKRYLEYVERMDRKKTRDSYRSRTNILKEYLKTMPTPILSTYNKMVAKSIEPLLPTLSDEQREIIENTGYVNLTENSENIINCALLLALEYIHEATNYAESCGGGGSTSSSWGRDKDDDDERWWMRCITQSVTMICNSSRKPKRKR